ncbi:MAG TPA: MMPL family transporter [Thermoleophilia bacterium]|nr:MMPL family transporter [Thermoleophilia bacterium]
MRRRISPQTVARYSAIHPWKTIGLWAVLVVIAFGLIGAFLPGALTAQYTFISNPGSRKGADLLEQRMGMPQKAHEIVVVTSPGQTASSPAFRDEVLGLQSRIAALGPGVVDSVVSAFRGGSPAAMISADGRTAIIPIVMAGDVVKAGKNIDKVHNIVNAADGRGGFQTLITGTASINSDFSHQATTDLRKGESIGLPIAIVILLIVFGTVVAASLPIFLALIAITLAIALTAIFGHLFSVSIFAVNMITLIGLAVGIDYSLFIVSRFREELTHGRSTIDAVAVAGGTAARAVFFSGMTVVLALCALLVVPTNIFVSLGAGAILVVAMAVFAALTLLPAVLGLLGPRVNRLRLPYIGRRLMDARAAGKPSVLARAARGAMRRPVLSLSLGIAVLLLAASPLFGMKTGVSGVNTLPSSFESKRAFDVVASRFSAGLVSPAQVVIDGPASSPQVQAAEQRLRATLAADRAFGPVQVQTDKAGDLTLLQVPIAGSSTSDLALGKVRELRDTYIPRAFAGSPAKVYVTGDTAFNVDYIDIVNAYFPWVITMVLALSFILLMLAFRSVVVPATAIVMNLLSVGAAYGLMTLVFQHGVGASFFGLQQVAVIEQWVPLFLFSVLFGLSMDYQVFLLSRIKEEYERTGDNHEAVSQGIGVTAGIITGAALIMVAVFAGFASGKLVMFEQMGFGLGVAVLLDATLVRTVLVPSAMSLFGRANWYLPGWLQWLPHLSIEGTPMPPAAEAGADAASAREGVAAAAGPGRDADDRRAA